MSRLALCVAPVALGLSRRLIFDHARYTGFLGAFPSFSFGQHFGLRGGSAFCRQVLGSRALLVLYPVPFNASFLTSLRKGRAFFLPCHFTWFGRSLCRTVGVEKRNLCVFGCYPTVRELVFSVVLQIVILIIGSALWSARYGPLAIGADLAVSVGHILRPTHLPT
ncbi:hypothetical protein ASD31_22415 [Rhizobium sp. Root482]|nr:hypothetical protein ASD31_22415 [Rhizobium sp. Root482]